MTTNGHSGDLAASRIHIDPTDRQRAANDLAAAFNTPYGVDWTAAEATFRALAETDGYESPTIEMGRRAAVRINEALLNGQEPLQADFDAVQIALEHTRNTQSLELTDGIPAHYWQGWLIQDWLPRNCVAMLTGDGG